MMDPSVGVEAAEEAIKSHSSHDDQPASNNVNGAHKHDALDVTTKEHVTNDVVDTTPPETTDVSSIEPQPEQQVVVNGHKPSDEDKQGTDRPDVSSAGTNGDSNHATEDGSRIAAGDQTNGDTTKAATETEEPADDSKKQPESSEKGRDRHRDERERHKHKSRDRDRDRDRDRERDRDRDYRKDRERDRKERKRSRSPSRSRSRKESQRSSERSRSKDKSKSRRRTRSPARSKDRRRKHHSRSRSRDRRRGRKSRSPSKPRSRKHESRSPSEEGGRRHRSSSAEYGGYVPRRRHSDMPVRAAPPTNADPFFYLRQSAPVPNDPQEAMRLWQEQQLRSRQLVLQQQAASAAAAASKTQREVYVGNLTSGMVTEGALKQVFNSALIAAYPAAQIPGMDPVVNVSMHSDGRYAFVELRSPEMATAALQLSGQVQLLGQAISVGRPSGYVDPTKAALAAQQAAAALAAFTAGDPSAAALLSPALLAAKSPPAGLTTGTPGTPGLSTVSAVPTEHLCVTGMVSADVLIDDQEYADVIDDLKDECGKFGVVLEVKIPRPSPPALAASLFGTGNFGKAFVKFMDPASAVRAREAVHGRMFAGSIVQGIFITAEGYQAIQ